MSTITQVSLDSSLLLNYYSAQLNSLATTAAQNAAANASSSSSSSSGSSSTTSFGQASTGSSSTTPPWDVANTESAQQETAQILATTNFVQPSTTPLVGTSGATAATQADNQKLFTLYQSVSKLSQLANIATQSGLTSGELAGYNSQFQTGLQQIESYVNSTSFNNLTLQTKNPSASVTSTASVPLASFSYTGGTVVSDANFDNALPGVSASDSFNIAVTKGGTTTNVPIDLSQIQGTLSIGNIVSYVNQQMKAAGFSSTFQTTITQGSISDAQKASYGIAITPSPGETVNLSAASSSPTLYLAGTTGATTGTAANSTTGQAAVSADNQGSITALTNLSSGTPTTVFNATEAPSTGTTTAQSTVVDAQGNVYVVGNATGNMGSQLNQGTQDAYLTKYDSAGNLQWSELLGSAGTASAYSLALNPQGGVVVAGSTTAQVNTSAVTNGNTDSFVAAYDANGNQTWTQQIPTLNNNQANAVTVDSQGNVYIGGSVTGGAIGAGQTSTGGTNAYLAELNSSGQIVSEQQFGNTGSSVSQMATMSDGSVVVASVQNGNAILSKYASGDITGSPLWQMNVGSLNGGTLNGIAVSGDQVYLSGTTSNAQLTANGQASVATPSNGSTSAFVFNATDNGTSATADTVSYVSAPGGSTSGGGLTVGPDGTVYLAGSTSGTLAGQTRNVSGVDNAFVAALNPDGAIEWTNQFGGADGQSAGTSVAINPTGASVLNALGLPSGTVNINQSVDLTSQTTLRAGDSFQLETEGTGGRTSTITITQGESLQDLATSINAELLSSGKATVTYANGGQALEITAKAGNTIKLIAGPADSDALGRLGIAPGVITAPSKSGSSSSSSTSSSTSSTTQSTSFGVAPSSSSTSSSATKQVFGLGLNSAIDLLSSSDANVAKISLQTVMTAITNVYQKTNTTASTSSSSTSSTSIGTVPSYLSAQVANYSLALASFSATSSLSSTSSSSSSSYGMSASLLQSVLTA